jgi:hypothetical protein
MKGEPGHYKMWDVKATEAKLSHILVVARLIESRTTQEEFYRHLREVERARLARVRARRCRGY